MGGAVAAPGQFFQDERQGGGGARLGVVHDENAVPHIIGILQGTLINAGRRKAAPVVTAEIGGESGDVPFFQPVQQGRAVIETGKAEEGRGAQMVRVRRAFERGFNMRPAAFDL